jgi:hypothetical protein
MQTPASFLVEGALEARLDYAPEGMAIACVFTPKTGERWASGMQNAKRAVIRSRTMLRRLEDERESFVVVRKGTGLAIHQTGSFKEQAVNVRDPLKHEVHFHDLGVQAVALRPGRLRPSGLAS